MHIKRENFPIDIDHQSIELPYGDRVRQSTLVPPGVTLDFVYDDAKTLVDIFRRGYKVSKNGPCLGWRDSEPIYKWLTYGEVIERSKNISHGLVHAGMEKGQDSYIGIYSQNRVEWVLVEQACCLQSAVLVPLYDTLGPEACTFVLNQVEAKFLVCDSTTKVKNILDSKENIPKLQHIIVIEQVDTELKDLASKKGVSIQTLKDVEDSGKQKPGPLLLPSPDDLATICYTSGTTGEPKGVMLTHRNILANASTFCKNLGLDYIGVEDVYISYLPSAHMFDRVGQVILYMNGGSVGFFRGDIKLLLEDFSALKPTMFPTVPRVLNKVFDKVKNEVNGSIIKKFLLERALRAKKADLEKGIIRNDSLWDRFVLRNIRNIFGGRLRLVVCGGAPIRQEVHSFFQCSLGCTVINCYGQTEATCAATCAAMGDYREGVGPPLSSLLMKLVDVPEMGYYARNDCGEVVMKGTTVTKGYFKNPVRTAEVLDEDGWLHTGDIGKWNKNGSLIIIDRKKHLLKLSQGEYVSPEKVESVYLSSSYVEMIFVHGDSLENFLVAVVSPEKDLLMSWCQQQGICGDWNTICKNKRVKEHILKDMRELGRKAELKGFEQVKAIHLHPDGFSLQNGILTATMKVKREVCRRQFKDVIERMYQNTRGKE